MTYATEAELCAAFVRRLPSCWTVYPEANGFDLFLVHASGYQTGIEAKLRPSLKLAAQLARHEAWKRHGPHPDAIAALLPRRQQAGDLRDVAQLHGWVILDAVSAPWLRQRAATYTSTNRCPIPEVVGDDAAGSPGGASCTGWKIQAIRLCLLMNERGVVTRQDFADLGIDIATWRRKGWLVADGKDGRRTRYVRGPEWPAFDAVHPTVTAQLAVAR